MPSSTHFSRIAGFALLIIAFLSDQWVKNAVIIAASRGAIPREIWPIFNLVLVRNFGISFGFLAHGQAWMPTAITVLTSLVALTLTLWLLRTREFPVGLALGLIIGGALGNIVDRVRLGSVIDFLDFHVGVYHWPAFNIADSVIFIGVVILVLISIVKPAPNKENAL